MIRPYGTAATPDLADSVDRIQLFGEEEEDEEDEQQHEALRRSGHSRTAWGQRASEGFREEGRQEHNALLKLMGRRI